MHLPQLVLSSRWSEAPPSPAQTYPPSCNTYLWHGFSATDPYCIFTEKYFSFSGTYSTKGKLPACLANRTQQAIHAPNAHIRKCFYLSTEILEKDTGKDKLSLLTTNWWPPGQGLLKAVNYLSVLWVFKRASPKQGCSVPQVLWHSIRRTNRYSRRQNLVWNSLALPLYPTGSFFFPLLFYWRC